MSRASRLTLMGTSLFAAGTILFVHFQQQAEKSVLPPLFS
jgi:protein PET117